MVGAIARILAVFLFVAPAARGAYNPQERVLIDEKVASNSASLVFTKGIDSTYKTYEFEFWGIRPATDNSFLRVRVTTDGGSTWKSASTDYYCTGWIAAGSNAWGSFLDTGAEMGLDRDSMVLTDVDYGIGNATGEQGAGTLTIYDPASSTLRKRFVFQGNYRDYTGDEVMVKGSGTYAANTAVNGFQWTFDSGNISGGTVRLYGIK